MPRLYKEYQLCGRMESLMADDISYEPTAWRQDFSAFGGFNPDAYKVFGRIWGVVILAKA